jgi:hypothetical protein
MNLDWIFEIVSFIGISHGFNIHLKNNFSLDRVTADMISTYTEYMRKWKKNLQITDTIIILLLAIARQSSKMSNLTLNLNLNADPDPTTQINADPCGSAYGSETLG